MGEMHKIIITSVVKTGICVASEDGSRLYKVLKHELSEGNDIEISFKGVEDLTSLFLNASICQLYKDFSEQQLKEHLSVTEIEPQDLDTLKRSVDRAKEYFKDPNRFHSVTEELLGPDDEQHS